MGKAWIYVVLLSMAGTYCAWNKNTAGVLWVIFLFIVLIIEKDLLLFNY